MSFETITSDMFEDLLCTLFHFLYRWLTIKIDEYHGINITNCKSISVHMATLFIDCIHIYGELIYMASYILIN